MADELSNLLTRLQGLAPTGNTAAPLGAPAPRPKYDPNNQPVSSGFGDAAIGAVNIFGGFMRGITGIGRGIVNYAGGVLPYANQMFDTLEDGFQAQDVPKLYDAAANATWNGLRGFTKGFTYSYMPPTAQSRKWLKDTLGGDADVYEGAYELFQSKDFEAAGENLPFLKEAASDEGIGFGIPDEWIGFNVPWAGIEKGKGLEFTKAGLYSFGFDVLSDPITYTPIGLGGAARGLMSGVRGATKGAKLKGSGTPFAELDSVTKQKISPQELYPELRPLALTKEGEIVRTASADAKVAYNAKDTNPLTYIGKEMARGYGSSWRAVSARAANRRIARGTRKGIQNILESAMLRVAKEGGDIADLPTLYSATDSIINEAKTSILQRVKDRKLNAEVARKVEGDLNARLDAALKSAQTPESAEMLAQNAARYKELLKNVPAERQQTQLRALIANDAARAIRKKVPIVAKAARGGFAAKEVNQLGDSFVAAQDATGSVGDLWDSFIGADSKAVNVTTKKKTLQAIFAPLRSSSEGDLSTSRVAELTNLIKGDITRRSPRATKGKGVKGSEQARATEVADLIDEARYTLEQKFGPLDKINPAKVTGKDIDEALASSGYRIAGERLRQLSLTEGRRVNKDYRNLEVVREGGYNPLTIDTEPRYFGGISASASGTNARTAQITKLAKASEDFYPAAIVDTLKLIGLSGIHRLGFQDLKAKASEALEALTYLSARNRDKVLTAEAYQGRLGNLKLSNIIRSAENPIDAELNRIGQVAEALFPNRSRVTKKEIDQLAKDLDQAVSDAIVAARELTAEEAIYAGRMGSSVNKFSGVTKLFAGVDRSGLPVSFIGESVRTMYNLSRRKAARDGGRFADYVDEVILEGAPMPKTVTEFETAFAAKLDKWDGEGLTTSLLVDSTAAIYSGGGKKLGTKNPGFNTFAKNLVESERKAALAKIKKEIEPDLIQRGLTVADGRKAILDKEAEDLLSKMWPERLSRAGYLKVAANATPEGARLAMLSEAILGRFSFATDVLARRRVKELVGRTRMKSAEGVEIEKANLSRTLDSLDKKLKDKGLSKKSEYRAIIEQLRTMTVITDAQRGEWKLLVGKLMDGTVEGAKRAYGSAQEVIQGFRDRLPDIELEDVARVLAAYGYEPARKAVEKSETFTVKQISRWLNGKGDEVITQAEKEAAERGAYIATSPFHSADAEDTMQALAMLSREDRQVYLREFEAQHDDLLSIAHSNGYGWLTDLAISSLGPSLKQFFVSTKGRVETITQKYLGRDTAIIEIEQALENKQLRRGVKETFESESQYMYFKEIAKRVDMHVLAGNFADPIKAKKDLILHAMRYAESYLALRGIVPAATPSWKLGAQELYELVANKNLVKQIEEMDVLPAFVTMGDIVEVLPDHLAKEFWFDGPLRSMPPTVQAEGVRVLVNHMSNLRAGEWFTDEQYQAVFAHMLTNMTLRTKKLRLTKDGRTWLDINGADGQDKLEAFIRYFLSDMPNNELEAPAFKMYERHRQNMLYSSIVLKETAPSGRIIGELREKWEALLDNPIASKETKYAALRQTTDELNKYLEMEDIRSDFGDMLAAQDALVNISQSLTRDDMLSVSEAAAIGIKAAAIAEVKSRGGKLKTVDLRLAKKEFTQAKKSEYIKLANARVDLTLDNYIDKAIRAGEAEAAYGPSVYYDLMRDSQTESGNVNFMLRFADDALRKLSYKYDMETLRPAIGGIQRYTMRNDNGFTKATKRTLAKWTKQTKVDGVEYLRSSLESLKLVKDKDLPGLINDLGIIIRGFGNDAQQKGISVKAGKEVDAALRRVRDLSDSGGAKIFTNFNDMKMNALADVAAPLLRVFDELGARQVDPRLLNFYLKQAGELNRDARAAEVPLVEANEELAAIQSRAKLGVEAAEAEGVLFNPNLDPAKLGSAWRDMNWDQHLKSLNSIHFAMSKAEEWYSIAGEATRLTGARRLSDTGGAIPEGFVKLKGMDELKLGDELTGKELYYFLDTDNYVYPAWAVNEIENLADFLGAPYRKGLGKLTQSQFFRRINTVQNFAKQMMTNMRAGNHLMNFMGGVLINDVAGMRNPANYLYSLRLLNAAGVSTKELGLSRNAAEYWMERHFAEVQRTTGLTIKEASDPTKNKTAVGLALNGKLSYVSYEDLAAFVMKEGGFVPWQQSANLDILNQMAGAPNLQALKKQGTIAKAWNETSEVVGSWASHRDDFVRMALFIDEIKKGNWNSLEDAVKGSLDKVNRYHPQPQEVSKFNRDVTRHLILFYTWRAKTLGVIVGDLLERPGRLVGWEKAYYNYQASQGYSPEYFGSHDPKDEAVLSYQQNNLGILVGGNEYSISAAHPMWDLMGSEGWLSQFKWDSNQGAAENVVGMALGTTTNVLYKSAPLVENLFVNWLAGRTANGQDLMRGGITEEDMPTIVQEVANSFGLNAVHATLAYFYPEQFNRAKWNQLTSDERSQELLRTWFNWSTGARATKYLTPDNKKKARAELRSVLSTLNKRNAPGSQTEGKQATSDLLDYISKLSAGSLGD